MPDGLLSLREKRCRFTQLVALLIQEANAMGFECALDEVTERITEKDPTSDHMKGSLHHSGLACDLLLYRDGVYLTRTEDHAPLGAWWEAQGTDELRTAWGGRFKDGNHYSVEHEGRK